MSQKAIREFDGKQLLTKWLNDHGVTLANSKAVQVTADTDLALLPKIPGNEWLLDTKLVVKPDQLIKRRGKSGLIKLNADFTQVCEWLEQYRNKNVTVDNITGELNTFIIEPFLPHAQSDEYYICIHSTRDYDEILFYHEGGVDIGDVDSKALRYRGPISEPLDVAQVHASLLSCIPASRQEVVLEFITSLYSIFQQLQFTYIEVNPLVFTTIQQEDGTSKDALAILDLAAKIDEAASFECEKLWNFITFPAPFGLELSEEERFIKELDEKTGASLKLTVLNPAGRIWLMVAGGGASVVYADTVADYGYGHELANYGEYSGAPTTQQTYDYARTILSLMTKTTHPDGKILLIGGGIANFTDVAATFKGVIKALDEYAETIKQHKIKIYVRRAGPNYQEGLRLLKEACNRLGLDDVQVYGPEMHMTSIVPIALGLTEKAELNYQPKYIQPVPQNVLPGSNNSNSLSLSRASSVNSTNSEQQPQLTPTPSTAVTPAAAAAATGAKVPTVTTVSSVEDVKPLFTPNTQAIVYGLQLGAVQNMLDFDFICGRSEPSVKCLVYPFQANHFQKFYWNNKEILLPCIQNLSDAIRKYPDVDCVVNFSSFRSVYETTCEIMKYKQIRTIAIIAEGVPERRSRQLIQMAQAQDVTIIGPATVGGLKPGCFRIGNAGGMLDNVVSSKLYRKGSVAYVTRSGGLSNEMNNILALNTDGVVEGIAIGGDRYPGTTFVDHLLRYQADNDVKMIVLLGEVGGIEEYEVCRLIKEGVLTKPLIAWCIGTCGDIFPYEVQFGHAGACANDQKETATAKNQALRDAGAIVPISFDQIGIELNKCYVQLVEQGVIQLKQEHPPPQIPIDYKWATKLGLVRKPASFISTISDERGSELKYAGMEISQVISSSLGVGGVVGLLWFRKQLPDYFCRFIELVLQLTADHGPAVSGAHNTIVTARAGKDLISSLCSGLLTIGPRFGGALDDAARVFTEAYDKGYTAEEFINKMRQEKRLIPGIGHKIKSLEDPDSRVEQLKQFVNEVILIQNPQMKLHILEFALAVEALTTKKKSNLILNVDGVIAVVFMDILRANIPDLFTAHEVQEYIDMGILNGLFVLGRSIGFIGHWIDQGRLKQPLYRHPDDDISYVSDYF